ncbi:MAG: hypothetical protein H0T60_03140, partial [Acidobacteria bacterium]|nr:hypothetical protein [Acidobacteriota bacterium]
MALAFVALLVACAVAAATSRETPWQIPSQAQTSNAGGGRTHYRITLKLDFDARTFAGGERVRWV